MADGTIIALDRGTYRAEVAVHGFGFIVRWGQDSVDEWSEGYPDLPTAIARLAVVDHVMAVGDRGWFRDEGGPFARRAAVLLADSVTIP